MKDVIHAVICVKREIEGGTDGGEQLSHPEIK